MEGKAGIKALQEQFVPCFSLHLFLYSPQLTSMYKMTTAISPTLTCPSQLNSEEGVYEWTEGGAKGGGGWI